MAAAREKRGGKAGKKRATGGRIHLARFERCVTVPWPPLRGVLRRILTDHGLAGELGLAVVGDETMARIHGEYLGEEVATDVLSFPLGAADGEPRVPGAVVGEVVVSAETALREARRRGLDPRRELALYAIHGVLHLAGYDDRSQAVRRRMRRAEARYLQLYDALIPPRRSSRRAPRRSPGTRGLSSLTRPPCEPQSQRTPRRTTRSSRRSS
jgi:probable rRNA maturation factor